MKLLDILYPSVCIHCDRPFPGKSLLCSPCLSDLYLLRAEGRCSKCFSEIVQIKGTCTACRSHRHPFKTLTSCFDGYGPAGSLLKRVGNPLFSRLEGTLASYIVVQLDRLALPIPDIVCTLPTWRGGRALGKKLGKLICRPYCNDLKRYPSLEPQFFLKKKWTIMNRSVLLLAGSSYDLEEIRAAARALQENGPETIHVVLVCL